MRVLIIIIAILFATNSFAQDIVFDRCWATNAYQSFDEQLKNNENITYEINLNQGYVVEIVIWTDKMLKHFKKHDRAKPKVEQDTFQIKSATSKYISTIPKTVGKTFDNSDDIKKSLVFYLDAGKIELIIKGVDTGIVNYKCEKVTGVSSGSSGIKGFLKKLLGNN